MTDRVHRFIDSYRTLYTALAAAAAGVLLAGSGCSHQTVVSPPPIPQNASPQAQQTKAQMIENNTGMPAAEKAAILSQDKAPSPALPATH